MVTAWPLSLRSKSGVNLSTTRIVGYCKVVMLWPNSTLYMYIYLCHEGTEGILIYIRIQERVYRDMHRIHCDSDGPLPPCLPLSTSSCRGGHDRTPQVPLWPDEVREWERWWGSIANKLRHSDQIRETMTTDAYRHQDKRPKGKRCNGKQSFVIGKCKKRGENIRNIVCSFLPHQIQRSIKAGHTSHIFSFLSNIYFMFLLWSLPPPRVLREFPRRRKAHCLAGNSNWHIHSAKIA